MTEPSPPTTRVIDVVELVAARDEQTVRAADLARDLGMSKATTHAIVQTLCDRGWLVRSAGKRLALGPGLAPVAHAALEQRSTSRRALEAARGLSGASGYTASVVELVGRTMYVTSIDPAQPRGPALSQRVGYAAPFGSLFAAWATADERAEWFRRGLVTGPAATSYDAFLDRARSDGVLVERMSPVVEHVAPLLAATETGGVSDDLRTMVRAVVDEVVRTGLPLRSGSVEPQPVTSVAAPIPGPDGAVATALVLHPLQAIGARELHRAKNLVRSAAEVVVRADPAKSGPRMSMPGSWPSTTTTGPDPT